MHVEYEQKMKFLGQLNDCLTQALQIGHTQNCFVQVPTNDQNYIFLVMQISEFRLQGSSIVYHFMSFVLLENSPH